MRLCIVMNHARTVDVLHRNLFEYLAAHDVQVTAVTPPSPEQQRLRERGVASVGIAFERAPSPVRDGLSLLRLWAYFVRHRFDVIHVSTPKAGLLGALAAVAALQFNVVYTVRGRAYENKRGWRRRCYVLLERVVCALSRRVLVISHELRQALVDEGACPAGKCEVLGHGSSNGIDATHFRRTPAIQADARALRASLGIAADDRVVLNIGRLTADKGIPELVQAFERLAPPVHLVLVGVQESGSPLPAHTLQRIDANPRIHVLDWLRDVRPACAMADVFAFATHREGFGNVALEASAMELPVVAFDVIGVRESVSDGESGVRVPFGDVAGFAAALQRLLDDPAAARALAAGGRARVLACFAQPPIWQELLRVYRDIARRRPRR